MRYLSYKSIEFMFIIFIGIMLENLYPNFYLIYLLVAFAIAEMNGIVTDKRRIRMFLDKIENVKQFKETEYGKKTNRWFWLSSIIAIIFVVVYAVLSILSCGENMSLTTTSEILLDLLRALTFISIISACYFDGKRDGAIEQYKKTLKKK